MHAETWEKLGEGKLRKKSVMTSRFCIVEGGGEGKRRGLKWADIDKTWIPLRGKREKGRSASSKREKDNLHDPQKKGACRWALGRTNLSSGKEVAPISEEGEKKISTTPKRGCPRRQV